MLKIQIGHLIHIRFKYLKIQRNSKLIVKDLQIGNKLFYLVIFVLTLGKKLQHHL